MKKVTALIDCQNDFIDGSLAVGYDKWAKAYEYIESKLLSNVDKIVFTQDYHPANHCSFVDQKGPWPSHCVENTDGVNFYWKLLYLLEKDNVEVLKKGMNPLKEEYGINVLKNDKDATEVHIAGLCTDYCVKESSIMTAKENPNVKVYVHLRGSAFIAKDTAEKAIKEMKEYKNIEIVE